MIDMELLEQAAWPTPTDEWEAAALTILTYRGGRDALLVKAAHMEWAERKTLLDGMQ